MESKISEANSHDEIFISVGDILIMAISWSGTKFITISKENNAQQAFNN
jgi:hypothetical protein